MTFNVLLELVFTYNFSFVVYLGYRNSGWVVIWRCIRLGEHSRIDFFMFFPSEIS